MARLAVFGAFCRLGMARRDELFLPTALKTMTDIAKQEHYSVRFKDVIFDVEREDDEAYIEAEGSIYIDPEDHESFSDVVDAIVDEYSVGNAFMNVSRGGNEETATVRGNVYVAVEDEDEFLDEMGNTIRRYSIG